MGRHQVTVPTPANANWGPDSVVSLVGQIRQLMIEGEGVATFTIVDADLAPDARTVTLTIDVPDEVDHYVTGAPPGSFTATLVDVPPSGDFPKLFDLVPTREPDGLSANVPVPPGPLDAALALFRQTLGGRTVPLLGSDDGRYRAEVLSVEFSPDDQGITVIRMQAAADVVDRVRLGTLRLRLGLSMP